MPGQKDSKLLFLMTPNIVISTASKRVSVGWMNILTCAAFSCAPAVETRWFRINLSQWAIGACCLGCTAAHASTAGSLPARHSRRLSRCTGVLCGTAYLSAPGWSDAEACSNTRLLLSSRLVISLCVGLVWVWWSQCQQSWERATHHDLTIHWFSCIFVLHKNVTL